MNPNQLDLNLLRVFDAILETRSVTVAASTLGLTQSAVTRRVVSSTASSTPRFSSCVSRFMRRAMK